MSNKTPPMIKKDKSDALVPRLRFPKFRDSQGWPLVPLQQLAERITARNSDESTTRVLTNSAEHGVIDQRDYFDKDIAIKGNLGNYYIVEHGDYVYNPRVSVAAPVGPISRNNFDKGVMSPLYTVFRFNRSDTDFYAHYFKSTSWHSYLRSVSSTGARHDRMSITNGDFMRMPVPEPQPAEQRKVADCLGSLDDLIAAEGRKLAALRDHKKGLMQQLFPRKGETYPGRRFPEFRDTAEWEERLIEEFFDVGSSKRVLQKDWTTEGVPFYRTRELVSLSRNEPFSSEVFISEELFSEISEKYGVPDEGDFLVSGVGTLGIAYQVRSGDRFYFKDGNVLWLKLTGDLISDFFNYCFQSDLIQDQISGQASVSTVGTYTIQNAKKTRFLRPIEPNEQQKIADCLASLDAMIAAHTEKLEALKTHKKGLMQQLFPIVEGMA